MANSNSECEEEPSGSASHSHELPAVTVARRSDAIENAITSSATAAGSVEATSHHADDEGESEIRSPADESSSSLDDIFDNVAPTQLPI